jgi:uncharacterized protein (DUF302 family)
MPLDKSPGIVTRRGTRSVEETVDIFLALLRQRNITVFALVDHSGEAANIGIDMRPAKLLIFGSPRAGTPAMLASPTIALDLPLKLLVWEDASGATWLSYNDPAYLQDRHGLPEELVKQISAVGALVEQAAL